MPPKAKFTKQEIIEAALAIVREQGFEALTARALGQKLESSARPIFTVFSGMDEVQSEVNLAARQIYNSYIAEGLKQTPAFKGVGTYYILFAIKEPKLFQLLFMREQQGVPAINEILARDLDDNVDLIYASIENAYGFDHATAKIIYHHLWIYSHGIGVLIATKVCRFTAEEISDMLTDVFISLLKKYKQENKT